MPKWWPLHADGKMVTHLYRLIDDDEGVDLQFPRLDDDMATLFEENQVVDFREDRVRNLLVGHVERSSASQWKIRCFLSTSLDIDKAIEFGRGK